MRTRFTEYDEKTIYITKYFLQRGVFEVTAQIDTYSGWARISKQDGIRIYNRSIFSRSEYALTMEEVQEQVETMLSKKLLNLKKQVAKLTDKNSFSLHSLISDTDETIMLRKSLK